MTPLDFSRWYDFDERALRGGYFSSSALEVQEGERVGVVLMNLGGPRSLDEVESFLYNLLMDPALVDLPIRGGVRHWLCKILASYKAESVRKEYELIGGSSPLNDLTREQAESLETYLNDQFGEPTGVDFRTYVAMRYGHPFSEEAAAEMDADDVDRVVLLPMYPQYSMTTSGSALAYWKALDEAGEIPSWPTTTAFEYATNPKYVQALSELIDEGLQRFQRERRPEVQLLFSAQGTPLRSYRHRQDPYCCLVHATVSRVMEHRGHDRPHHTAFQNRIGFRDGLTPSTPDVIDALADDDEERSLLVVPLPFTTDHLQTSHGLDIELREWAEMGGIRHYEVTSGLNTHPLFIEALSEVTLAQLDLPVDINQLRIGGDGLGQEYPLRPIEDLPRDGTDAERCPSCNEPLKARHWRGRDELPDSDVLRPGSEQDSSPSPSASEPTS
jgi:ferrochelatase